MPMPTPAAAAQKWSQNLGAAVTRYTDGVKAVTTSPNQSAAAAVDRWIANVQAAQAKYVANNQAVTLQYWQSQAAGKGAQRLGPGATAAEPKMQSVFTSLFPFISQVVGSLPPRGGLDANIARSAAFQRAMANYRKS